MAESAFRAARQPPRRLTPRLRAGEAAVLVVLPLLVGGALYLGFRTDRLLMFAAADHLGLGGHVDAYRANVTPLRAGLADWMVFSLPNALWTLSLVSFAGLLWRCDARMAARWLAAASVLAVAPEVLQAAGLLPGTFSMQDLATGIAACVTAVLGVHLLPFILSLRST